MATKTTNRRQNNNTGRSTDLSMAWITEEYGEQWSVWQVHISEHSDHPFRDYTIADFAIIRSRLKLPIPSKRSNWRRKTSS